MSELQADLEETSMPEASVALSEAPVAPVAPAASSDDVDLNANLHVLELRVRILGGSQVLLAIDRLACPMPGARSAVRMKESMMELQKWASKFDAKNRAVVMSVIGRHVKRAIEIMKTQKTEEAIDE